MSGLPIPPLEPLEVPPIEDIDDLVLQFQEEAATVTTEPWYQDLGFTGRMAFLVIGLGQEAGEVQEVYKKALAKGDPPDLAKIVEELGDTMWHIAAVCNREGILLADVMKASLLKFRQRHSHRFKEVPNES
jgi:NTP pyrophosphatase (non-canonical NTP hydrolase)